MRAPLLALALTACGPVLLGREPSEDAGVPPPEPAPRVSVSVANVGCVGCFELRAVGTDGDAPYTFEWDGMPGHVIVETVVFEELPDQRTRVLNPSLFHTTEDRDGMMSAGMEQGLNQSYEALDRLLADHP
jgi:hypothetical protein